MTVHFKVFKLLTLVGRFDCTSIVFKLLTVVAVTLSSLNTTALNQFRNWSYRILVYRGLVPLSRVKGLRIVMEFVFCFFFYSKLPKKLGNIIYFKSGLRAGCYSASRT